MSWSLTYDGIDLSAYGLIVTSPSPALVGFIGADLIQLPDLSYATGSILPPKSLNLSVIVKAASSALLKSYLDSIKRICGQRQEKQLRLDILDDRYFLARYEGLNGRMISPYAFEGELVFSADDPLAFKLTETSSDFNINADPKTITEAVGGTAYVKPVYTITAGENHVGITLKIENTDTGEELQWEGDLANGEVLTIDVGLWVVKKEGTEDMADVSGQFPRLIPGEDNHIKVTGFSNTGTLNITYRERYL